MDIFLWSHPVINICDHLGHHVRNNLHFIILVPRYNPNIIIFILTLGIKNI